MANTLESGRFLGRILKRRRSGDLRLADVRYTAGASRHAHEQPYFCLIRRGHYTERYRRGSRECRPMTVAFHPSGMQHAITLGTAAVRSLNVELGSEWLGWMLERGIPTDQPVECHGGPGADASVRLCLALEEDADRLSIDALVAEIVAGLCRPPAAERRPKWLADVPDLLDGELSRQASLRDLAAAAGVHPVHFAAVFRRFHGCSVGEYGRRRRVVLARRQLADLDRSLAEVAAAAGFADQSHFTRAFKRFTGLTPGRYRALLEFKTSGTAAASLGE